MRAMLDGFAAMGCVRPDADLVVLNGPIGRIRIEPAEVDGDGGLEALARWQGRAVDVVADLLLEHRRLLDALLRSGSRGAEFAPVTEIPDFACPVERDLDPEVPPNAVRIVLDLALDAALEPSECRDEAALIAGARRQGQAIDAVRALVALAGDALDEALSRRPMKAPPGSVASRNRPLAVISRDPVRPNVVAVSFKVPPRPEAG
jgi:hypothetical protein